MQVHIKDFRSKGFGILYAAFGNIAWPCLRNLDSEISVVSNCDIPGISEIIFGYYQTLAFGLTMAIILYHTFKILFALILTYMLILHIEQAC